MHSLLCMIKVPLSQEQQNQMPMTDEKIKWQVGELELCVLS